MSEVARLYNISMKLLLKDTKNKSFFTQEEYNKNRGIIDIMNGHKNNIDAYIKLMNKVTSK